MIMALLDALALVWIMAHEQEDPEDGEERIATAACALPRNDREEAAVA